MVKEEESAEVIRKQWVISFAHEEDAEGITWSTHKGDWRSEEESGRRENMT